MSPLSDLQTIILNSTLVTHVTKQFFMKNISSGLIKPVLFETMVIDESTYGHAPISRLIYTESHIYQAYLELLFSIQEVSSTRFGLLQYSK